MRTLVIGALLLSCGCAADTKPTSAEVEKSEKPKGSEPNETTGSKDKTPEQKDKGDEPIPKGKSDADTTRDLVGKWDGLQILRNARGMVPVDGIVTFNDGGAMQFDGQARQGTANRQIIGFGTWSVKNGLLVCVVESSNISKEVPNGSVRTVQVREVTELELLYIDPVDQRTYSAKRVTRTTPSPKPPSKKK